MCLLFWVVIFCMSNVILILLSFMTGLGSAKIITVLTLFPYAFKPVLSISAKTANIPSPSLIPTGFIMRKQKKSLWKICA